MSTARILIVEDESIISRDIAQQLRHFGYEVVGQAMTADECLVLAERHQPNLALMDIHIAGARDGIDAALELRNRWEIPSVFLTAYATDDVVARATQARPLGYLIKPFDQLSLRTTIEIALNTDRVERQLREKDASLQLRAAALQAAANGIVITDPDGMIQWVNPAFSALTGFTAAEAIGRNLRELVRSGFHPREFYEDMWKTLLGGMVWEGELTNRRKDGSIYTEHQTITPVRNAAGILSHYIGIKRDITEQKKLQEQLAQSQKMEVIGKLAGGVAHDFNNLLTVINGTAELALDDLAADHPLRPDFLNIQESGQRASRLTRQLLAFSRKQVLSPDLLNLSSNVESTAKMLQRLIGEDIRLVVDAESSLSPVFADPGQIEQVLMNLAVNARDAMPTGGTLTITTRNADGRHPMVLQHPELGAGPHVVVTVADTGTGMTPDVQARIFEPFFTTKGVGKGTGLGLATVYGIIEQSGGHIFVDSEVGRGTTFAIVLPVAPPNVKALGRGIEKSITARGTETLLLADDDDGLRWITSRFLRAAGYRVLEAKDGPEALAIAAAHIGPLHALLADVVMPGMSGPELATALVARRPGLKVLFTSGYTEDAMLRKEFSSDVEHFLPKPYTGAQLTAKMRRLLDS